MAERHYKGYTLKITTNSQPNPPRIVQLRANLASHFTTYNTCFRSAHRIDLGDMWTRVKMENLLSAFPDGTSILSINDLPSYLRGPKANQLFMTNVNFQSGGETITRRIRFVSDDTKFAFFAATLAKLMTWEPILNTPDHDEWTREVIVTCFGMWQLADRLGYLDKTNEDPLPHRIWMEDAVRFLSRGYNVTGRVWPLMGSVGFGVAILDPDYVYDETLIEPETSQDRKIIEREKQSHTYKFSQRCSDYHLTKRSKTRLCLD